MIFIFIVFLTKEGLRPQERDKKSLTPTPRLLCKLGTFEKMFENEQLSGRSDLEMLLNWKELH